MDLRTIEQQLHLLEQSRTELEIKPSQYDAIHAPYLAYAKDFLDKNDNQSQSEPLKAFHKNHAINPNHKGFEINDSKESADQIIEWLEEIIDTPGLNPASHGHLGYIPGGGVPYSAIGDYLAAISNRYAGVFFASPGAVMIENALIKWMGNMVGYTPGFAGNIASGGSIANLNAICAAREAHQIKTANIPSTVIYGTEQMHHSLHKTIKILGLSECVYRSIPLDSGYRMKATALQQQIEADKKSGLQPWLILAAAGSTDVGAIDPLDKIGDIAQAENLWFHIDGAYGGFFLLAEDGKTKLRGIEKADSVILDPHKGLFLPYGCGVTLVKNGHHLKNAFAFEANYMQDIAAANQTWSPAELSPELTKHFRGLRIWLPLKQLGIKPFKAAVEEKLLLAQYFYHKLSMIDGFELGDFPDLSVVTYRYLPKTGDADLFNQKLIAKIHEDGAVFISSTLLQGKFTLRLAVLSFRTNQNTIDTLIEQLTQFSLDIEKEMQVV